MSEIGVLALQGAFQRHVAALERLGLGAVLVRRPEQLARLAGLILPGGESSVQLELIARAGLEPALLAFARSGRPILGTCAGLILLAREVRSPVQRSFGLLDVCVARNAWGRQIDSFEAEDDEHGMPLVFIRAPRILEHGRAEVLARYRGEPVLVRQGNVLAATFHPELTSDLRVYAHLGSSTSATPVKVP